MTEDEILVRFDEPPVTEVVVAVAFDSLQYLTVAHLGQLWTEELREEFPQVEERSPYEPPIESFDGPNKSQLSLTFSSQPPSPRLWFKSADDQDLLQIQNNWFACNWRKVGKDSQYSHWPSRRDAFVRWFSIFNQFLQSKGLGKIRPIQCEVTYINHIVPDGVWHRHGEIAKVFNTISDTSFSFLPEPEQIRFATTYVMKKDGEPVGRLHLNADPVVSVKDNTHALSLNLTARGAPFGSDLDGIIEFLSMGREWIVRGFQELTTEAMHIRWGKQS